MTRATITIDVYDLALLVRFLGVQITGSKRPGDVVSKVLAKMAERAEHCFECRAAIMAERNRRQGAANIRALAQRTGRSVEEISKDYAGEL